VPGRPLPRSAQRATAFARLNADGTLDNVFDPNANGPINAIVVQADGKILVAGTFNGANSIGGQPRNRKITKETKSLFRPA
jgi:hypothetical protein